MVWGKFLSLKLNKFTFYFTHNYTKCHKFTSGLWGSEWRKAQKVHNWIRKGIMCRTWNQISKKSGLTAVNVQFLPFEYKIIPSNPAIPAILPILAIWNCEISSRLLTGKVSQWKFKFFYMRSSLHVSATLTTLLAIIFRSLFSFFFSQKSSNERKNAKKWGEDIPQLRARMKISIWMEKLQSSIWNVVEFDKVLSYYTQSRLEFAFCGWNVSKFLTPRRVMCVTCTKWL